MDNKSRLLELAKEVVDVEVDGARAGTLVADRDTPQYETSEEIALTAGITRDSPRYSGLHNHCQYSRTC
jgi:hypothetical protein